MSKVLYEKRGKIAYVTLNRPEAMNAVDPEMHQLLWELWTDFRDDDGVELAIVTGADDQAFTAIHLGACEVAVAPTGHRGMTTPPQPTK
jgi:enoyl-CoA hydratase/carnithine racemase